MLALSRMLAWWYDIGTGTNISKDMWAGNWQTSCRQNSAGLLSSSCLTRSCANLLRANVFGEVLDTRQIKDNMAAAVEGTDRRVRALLSSFLHTSGKEDESR